MLLVICRILLVLRYTWTVTAACKYLLLFLVNIHKVIARQSPPCTSHLLTNFIVLILLSLKRIDCLLLFRWEQLILQSPQSFFAFRHYWGRRNLSLIHWLLLRSSHDLLNSLQLLHLLLKVSHRINILNLLLRGLLFQCLLLLTLQ